MKLILIVIISILIGLSCNSNPQTTEIESSNLLKNDSVHLNTQTTEVESLNRIEKDSIQHDTIDNSVPIRIGNEKGILKIQGIRTFTHGKLTDSYFVIALEGVKSYPFNQKIDKAAFITPNKTLFKDKLNADFTKEAIIEEITFDAVRSNVLYFFAVLENRIYQKEISGRFGLFYRTKRKGKSHGWDTFEIKNITL